ncbi:3-oxoadipate enol-lactonase [Haloechinothrix halophila]|uniref:3-oxoadipate enol-lactonase n=1 Tax=Haloechinothrix halophila TaxID=1069073 RepID=UPI000419DB76|nr:3-oxoadipate enol-lactonase [Haloechinothrix halophila]
MEPHYVSDGPEDGSVVVLSGSLGSDVRMWQPQVAPLADAGYRVVRHDHRGHGGSPVPPGPYSLDDLGGDAVELLDAIGVARVHWVGLSLGGMLGMWLAAHSPDRIASLTACCTAAKLGPPEMWAERARMVSEHGTGAVAEAVVARWFTPEFAAAHPDRIDFYQRMVAATPAEGYAGCCRAIERMDLLDVLGTITTPTLVISGAEDPATPPEHGRRIADGVPGARFEVVDDAAHLGSAEQPEAVTSLLLDHLKEAS